jgi:hypothetical protein
MHRTAIAKGKAVACGGKGKSAVGKKMSATGKGVSSNTGDNMYINCAGPHHT